jgi:hypothetical protein
VLKITIMETATESRWIVEGRLVGPWVNELRTTWKRPQTWQDQRACIIDLHDVTFIDKSGERLLRAMAKKGAHFLASGMYTKHVLEKVKTAGKRGLVMLVVCLFVGLQPNVVVPITREQARPARMEVRVKEGFAGPRSRSTQSSLHASGERAALCQ